MIYDTPSEAVGAIISFIKEGLEQGNQCIHVGDDGFAEGIQGALRRQGADVKRALKSHSLQFTSEWEYRHPERWNAALFSGSLEQLKQETQTQGFRGLHLSFEMSWVLDPQIKSDRAAERESLLDSAAAESHLSVLCAYDRKRLKPGVCLATVQTHPHFALNEHILSNPFYRTQPLLNPRSRAQFLRFTLAELRELDDMARKGIFATDSLCVPVHAERDILAVRQKAREIAATVGFLALDQASIATVVSELARNIVLYARHGHFVICPIQRRSQQGLLVIARDEGPGISDAVSAVRRGHSRGLGLGLAGVRQVMDQFEITTAPNKGTTIRVTKWAN